MSSPPFLKPSIKQIFGIGRVLFVCRSHRRSERAVFTSRSSTHPVPALGPDSSQASVASGPGAGVKDDLLLVGLMGA